MWAYVSANGYRKLRGIDVVGNSAVLMSLCLLFPSQFAFFNVCLLWNSGPWYYWRMPTKLGHERMFNNMNTKNGVALLVGDVAAEHSFFLIHENERLF